MPKKTLHPLSNYIMRNLLIELQAVFTANGYITFVSTLISGKQMKLIKRFAKLLTNLKHATSRSLKISNFFPRIPFLV